MSVGSFVRTIVGPKSFRVLGGAYRRIFVDMNRLVDELARVTPAAASVLDVGGGDGAPINGLLSKRGDVSVTMLDIGSTIGGWIENQFLSRVTLLPNTPLSSYLNSAATMPDIIFMLDVIHHIPSQIRPAIFAELGSYFDRRPDGIVVIKDVEPGHFRATLGLWSDLYITGDRTVSLVSQQQLTQELHGIIPAVQCRETGLYGRDPPNYVLEIRKVAKS